MSASKFASIRWLSDRLWEIGNTYLSEDALTQLSDLNAEFRAYHGREFFEVHLHDTYLYLVIYTIDPTSSPIRQHSLS